MSSDKHLVYVTAWRASVYVSRGATLALAQHFPNDEDGYAGFAAYLAAIRPGIVYLLADVVEEDFHLDMLPAVRGSDRRALIGRRLAQRYRDTSLTLAMSLGYEKTQRRDERVLLSSFTNTQMFQPWLNVLRQTDLPFAGVYSIALMAPLLAHRLGYRKGNSLIVSLQPAGLRQTLVRDGKLRFSRLGPLDPAEAEQPTRVAQAFVDETFRIYQYLTAVRVLPRDEGVLDVLLVAPAGRRALVQAAASDTAQLRYRVIDVAEAADTIGLRTLPPGADAAAVYMHLLAQKPPAEQYLAERFRNNYRVLQARNGLVAAGAFALAGCAMIAGFQWWNIYERRGETAIVKAQARQLEQNHARLTERFPRIPTSVENLKITLQQHSALLKQSASPEAMLVELSAALGEAPAVQVESLKWQNGVAPPKTAAAGATPGATPGATTGATTVYETIELSGRIVGVPANDYRAVAAAVNGFIERLRARAGIEVLARKLPFDVGSEASITGDEGGSPQSADGPAFSVTIGRRIAL